LIEKEEEKEYESKFGYLIPDKKTEPM